MASTKPRSPGRKAKTAAVKAVKPMDAEPQAVKPLALVHDSSVIDADDHADDTGPDGADDTTAARASALRAILIGGKDAQSIEWHIKRQWPRLKDDAGKIVESAQRTADKWKPGAERVIGGMQKIVTSIEEVSERFVMLAVPGQPSCIAQISDALPITDKDFKARLANSVIVTGVDNKGDVKALPAASTWIGDRRRRTANKIVFTSRKGGGKCFNLWTEFGVAPKPGKCDLIHRHIREVICADDPVKYEAFENLVAWQTQNIGRSSRIVVDLFSQAQQTGKGVLLEKILKPMFGLHGLFTADSGKVFGRFNDAIRGKAYIAFDEACFAGDKQLADKIKSASGTETTSIEGKGIPVIECPTAANYYMATNRPHSAHIEWDDVRYWILKVSPKRKGDNAYWAELFEEINNGGVQAFLHDMLTRDVSNFIPSRDVPRDNDEHRANQRASDPVNPALWILDCLDNGLWLGSEKFEGLYSADKVSLAKISKGALPIAYDPSGEKMLPALTLPGFLEGSYKEWASTQCRHAQAAAKDEFWGHLTELQFISGKAHGKRYRSVPDEETLRSKIKERMKLESPHDEGNPKPPKGSEEPPKDSEDSEDSDFPVDTKTAGNGTGTSISPRFSGETAFSPSFTVQQTKTSEKAAKTAAYQGTVSGTVNRTVKHSEEVGGDASPSFTDPATVHGSSNASQANRSNGSKGGSRTEANEKANRRAQTIQPHKPSKSNDDGCSGPNKPLNHGGQANGKAVSGYGTRPASAPEAGKASTMKVAL